MPSDPDRLARVKAPAGGAITNNQFQQGGQFLPSALGRIRDVVARFRAGRKAKLARAPVDPKAEAKRAAIARNRAKAKAKPQDQNKPIPETKGPLAPASLGDALPPAETLKAQPTLLHHQIRGIEDAHGVPDAERLTNHPSYIDRGTHVEAGSDAVASFLDTLSARRLEGHPLHAQVKSKRLRGVQKLAYLIPHMIADTGYYGKTGASEWYGTHLDALDRGLHSLFGGKDPAWGNGKKAATAPWVDHPAVSIAKALIAMTSGGMNPQANTLAAVKMMMEGKKRAGPNATAEQMFLAIPNYNEPALHAWLEQAHALHPTARAEELHRVGPDARASADYWEKYIKPHEAARLVYDANGNWVGHKTGQAKHAVYTDRAGKPMAGLPEGGSFRQALENHAGAGYKAIQVLVDKASGKPVGYLRGFGDKQEAVGFDERPMDRAGTRVVDAPDGGEDGKLQPKGWTNRGEQVEGGFESLKTLIAKMGLSGASHWLLHDHSNQEFNELFGRVPDKGYLAANEHVPGSFILGPKFGPFLLNLHNNDESRAAHYGRFLTADLWFTRTWNRYMGRIMKGVGAKRKQVKAPTTKAERVEMFRAAQAASQKLGLRSVAELQAVLWYYEQNLWRWFGSNTPSFSYHDGINAALARHGKAPVKLSRATAILTNRDAGSLMARIALLSERMAQSGRIPDADAVVAALIEAIEGRFKMPVRLSRGLATMFPKDWSHPGAGPILADHMADEGDPREELVRNHDGLSVSATPDAMREGWALKRGVHSLPDGQGHVIVFTATHPQYPEIPLKHRVVWRPKGHAGFSKLMDPGEFQEWAGRWPEEHEDAIRAAGRGEKPHKLARPADYTRPPVKRTDKPVSRYGYNKPVRTAGGFVVKHVRSDGSGHGSPYAEEAAGKLQEHLDIPGLRPKRAEKGDGHYIFTKYDPSLRPLPQLSDEELHPQQVLHQLLGDYLIGDSDRNTGNYAHLRGHGIVSFDHAAGFHPSNIHWSEDAHENAPHSGDPNELIWPITTSELHERFTNLPGVSDPEADPAVVDKAIGTQHERHLLRLAWEGTEDLPHADRLAAVKAMRARLHGLRVAVRENGGKLNLSTIHRAETHAWNKLESLMS